METTHSRFIGRAPGPLSPPTITQVMPERSISPRSSSKGSTDRKRTLAGASRRSSTRGNPYFRSSTLTPHQIFSFSAANRSLPPEQVAQPLRSFSQHLIGVPVRRSHHPRDRFGVF